MDGSRPLRINGTPANRLANILTIGTIVVSAVIGTCMHFSNAFTLANKYVKEKDEDIEKSYYFQVRRQHFMGPAVYIKDKAAVRLGNERRERDELSSGPDLASNP